MSSCSATNVVQFSTAPGQQGSAGLTTYISSLQPSTVLIGITAYDAAGSLSQSAKSALLGIGVDVNGLVYNGKASFVAQIGQPAITVSQLGPSNGNNVKITVNVTGIYKHVYAIIRSLSGYVNALIT